MNDSIPQKKIVAVPLDDGNGTWQIHLIKGEILTVLNIHDIRQLTRKMVKDILQHVNAEPSLGLIIEDFISVEDIEIETNNTRFIHSFGYTI